MGLRLNTKIGSKHIEYHFWEKLLDLIKWFEMHIGVHGVYRGKYEEIFVNDKEIKE